MSLVSELACTLDRLVQVRWDSCRLRTLTCWTVRSYGTELKGERDGTRWLEGQSRLKESMGQH